MSAKIAKILLLFATFFVVTNPTSSFAKFRKVDYKKCNIGQNSYDAIIDQVKAKNYNALTSPIECITKNQKLIFEACTIDPKQLLYAKPSFRKNENFVLRLVKINPEIIQYADPKLRSNNNFLLKSLFIYRDALKYASSSIKDNLGFMSKAINRDSRNYIFASKRIQKIPRIAKMAFSDNGNLMLYAPEKTKDDKKLALVALGSSPDSFQFLSKRLRNDIDIIKASKYKDKRLSKSKIEKHILNHYLFSKKKGEIERVVDTNFSNFPDKQLIKRNFIAKWHKSHYLKGSYLKEKWKLVSYDSRNFVPDWKNDMKEYPELTKKITRFFKRRLVDNKTINNLTLTYLWEVNGDPKTLAFNLYLLRDSKDIELEDGYANVTSVTAIARKTKDSKDWRLSVIEVVFDKEILVDVGYKYFHKKHFVQDLYLESKKDKEPKVIFLVEDKYSTYFEVFSKSSGDKYQLSYRVHPNKIDLKNKYDLFDEFNIKRSREEQEEHEWQHMMDNCQSNPSCAKKIY